LSRPEAGSRWVVTAFAALTVACTGAEGEPTIVYDPYEGEPAFPSRREAYTMPSGDLGLTSDNGSDTVTLIDLGAGEVMGIEPIGRDPVDNDGPHHITANRAEGFAYVALAYPAPAIAAGPHAAHGSSTRSGFVQKLSLDDLSIVGEVRVDTNPGDIVLSEDGRRLVVSHFDLQKAIDPGAVSADERRATLAVIDPDTLVMSGSPGPLLITTCVAPHGTVLSRPDGRFAFAACYGEDSVAVVDLDDPAAITRVQVGSEPGPPGAPAYGPYGLSMSADGGTLAVSSTLSHDVRFFGVASRAFEGAVISTSGAPYFAAFSQDGTKLYIPTQSPDALVVAEVATGSVLSVLPFSGESCALPHEAVLSSDGLTLYVVCEGDHASASHVLSLDPETLAVRTTFTVGVYPDRLFVAPAP